MGLQQPKEVNKKSGIIFWVVLSLIGYKLYEMWRAGKLSKEDEDENTFETTAIYKED